MCELRKAVETEHFDPHSVAIFTTTLYKRWYPGELQDINDIDKVRGDEALRTLSRTAELNMRTHVVEGGSPSAFIEELDKRSISYEPERPGGMSSGRLQALQKAATFEGAKWLFWTEPEKVSFIDAVPGVTHRMAEADADMGIPGRDVDIFKDTHPEYMVLSQQRGNRWINRLLHGFMVTPENQNFDWFFGPMVFKNSPELMELFSRPFHTVGTQTGPRHYVDPKKYSNFTIFPAIRAMQEGKRVINIPDIPFRYPELQNQNEQMMTGEEMQKLKDKRRGQYIGLVTEALHYLAATTPNSPITGEIIIAPDENIAQNA